MLTNDSQAQPGNTVKIGDDEVRIVDSLPSGNGGLLVVRPTGDQFGGLAHVLVYAGDLIDHEDAEHVSGPVAPGATQQEQAQTAAQDAKIRNLEAKLAELEARESAVPEAQVVPDENPAETTDTTGATVPGETPVSDAQVVEEA